MNDKIEGEQNIRLFEPDDAPKWDEFVDKHPRASIYHKAVWRDVIRRSFRHETYYLIAEQCGSIRAVLPLVRLKGVLFGDFMVSMPFFNYGGPLGVDNDAELEIMSAAQDLAKKLSVQHIEYRETTQRPEYPVSRTDKVILDLELPSTADELFKALGTKRRTRIRRPTKEGAVTRHGGIDQLPDFYSVFSTNMRDLGTPVYGRRFFEEILTALPDSTSISVVRMHEQPVAAAFLVAYRDRMEVPWASTLRSYNRYAVNMLLYWEILKLAIDRGFKHFDFGRSTAGGTHHSFKEQWGAQPTQVHWNYWLAPSQPVPSLSPDNPKFALAIRAWKRLPVRVATLIGPHIVKYLP